ncbi:MAG: MFS transporter [Cyanobacteria bacterium J06635_15]
MPVAQATPLKLSTKLAYGIGELGVAAPISVGIFLGLFFLTDVVGLRAGTAGTVLLLGRVWDGINDPLTGWLSDRTRSPWGRRYPWMVGAALPLGVGCALQWWVPPLGSESYLFMYYGGVSLLIYASFTAVQLPFTALAAELTPHYDERTSLTTYKAGFNLAGGILGLLMAQVIFAVIDNPRQQYLALGIALGVLAVGSIAIAVMGTYPRYCQVRLDRISGRQPGQRRQRVSPRSQGDWLLSGLPRAFFRLSSGMGKILGSLIDNAPFCGLVALYLCSWLGIQVTAAMLPYFVQRVMALPENHVIQMAIAVQATAILALPGWNQLAQRTSKKTVYVMGAPIAIAGLMVLGGIQPGQMSLMYGCAMAVGFGIATFYLVPLAMLPDVIDWDELRTGQRREGLFVSVMVFLQKGAIAIALFLTAQLLDWLDRSTLEPTAGLGTIRVLMSWLPGVTIGLGLVVISRYGLSRDRHRVIQRRLQNIRSQRRLRSNAKPKEDNA